MTDSKAIEKLSFEEALRELTELVKKIDTNQETLSGAITAFERGVLLKNHCEQQLAQAKLKIDKIMLDAEGKVVQESLDNI